MKMKLDEDVTVVMYYSAKKKNLILHRLSWQNKDYELGPLDGYHLYKEGEDIRHVFQLCDTQETLNFRLELSCMNLHWKLKEVSDGLAD